MAALDTERAIAVIRDSARRSGRLSAECADGRDFHELIVTSGGELAINAYAGEPVPIATTLEELPEPVIGRLLAACGEPGSA